VNDNVNIGKILDNNLLEQMLDVFASF